MNNFSNAIKEAKENEKYMIEAIILFAKQNRCYYEELIRNGFAKEEALKLTIAHGMRFNNGGG